MKFCKVAMQITKCFVALGAFAVGLWVLLGLTSGYDRFSPSNYRSEL